MLNKEKKVGNKVYINAFVIKVKMILGGVERTEEDFEAPFLVSQNENG